MSAAFPCCFCSFRSSLSQSSGLLHPGPAPNSWSLMHFPFPDTTARGLFSTCLSTHFVPTPRPRRPGGLSAGFSSTPSYTPFWNHPCCLCSSCSCSNHGLRPWRAHQGGDELRAGVRGLSSGPGEQASGTPPVQMGTGERLFVYCSAENNT